MKKKLGLSTSFLLDFFDCEHQDNVFATAKTRTSWIFAKNASQNDSKVSKIVGVSAKTVQRIRLKLGSENCSVRKPGSGRKSVLNGLNFDTIDWQPNSPDLNPIENAWGLIKRRLSEHKIDTIDVLKSKVIEIWDDLSNEYLTTLVESMPKRIEMCWAANGERIPY